MIRTATYNDSKFKIVPIEADEIQIQQGCLSQTIGKFANYEEWWNSHSSGVSERIRDLIAKDYRAMIAAAPEYNDSVICKKCNGNMKQGTAIQNSIVSATPDFPDQLHGVTMSMDGEAAMVSCMKCEKCGNSFSIKDNK